MRSRREDREEELRKLLENERVRHREDKDEKRQMEEDVARLQADVGGAAAAAAAAWWWWG